MKNQKMKRKDYEKELEKLQVELVHLQEWVKAKGLKVVVIFEGRDAAGKGGIIRRITERVSPRVFRIVALPAPNDRQKSQWYLQRYVEHLPASGEVVIFDRSWYNRLGVEKVMGFCNQKEYDQFIKGCPRFEESLQQSGIILIKYFLVVNQEEQEKRFLSRINDSWKQWKLSPMDVVSYEKWWDYTEAFDKMMKATDTKSCPWNIVRSNDKRRARLNCITHFLKQIPYKKMSFKKPVLPKRKRRAKHVPVEPRFKNFIPEVY